MFTFIILALMWLASARTGTISTNSQLSVQTPVFVPIPVPDPDVDLSDSLTSTVPQVDIISRMLDDRRALNPSWTTLPNGINATFESNISNDEQLDGIVASEGLLTGCPII